MKALSRSCICLGVSTLLISVGSSATAFGRQDTPISIRVSSNAVLLDLIVTDRNGNLITDLRPEEVRIFEDGKEQKLQFFDLVGAVRDEPTPVIRKGILETDAVRFSSPSESPVIVILVDLGSLEADDVGSVRRHIAQFLQERPSDGTRYLLATTGFGLQVRQGFTSDTEKVQARLAGLQTVGNPDQFSYLAFLDEVERIFEFRFLGDSFSDFLQNVAIAISKAGNMLTVWEQRVMSVTGDLKTLSGYLQSVPGRKHIVFYSAGYPMQPTATFLDMLRRRVEAARFNDLTSDQKAQLNARFSMIRDRQMRGVLQTTIDRLNRSQVSVYGVDARGLMTYQLPPRRRHSLLQRNGRQLQYASSDITEPQDFIVSLASSTGGTPFLNSNDLGRGLDEAYRDSSRYYLVAYEPGEDRKEGKFHKIRVEVDRPDVEIRYRDGYIEKSEGGTVRSEIYAALTHPWLYDDVGMRLEVEDSGSTLNIKTHFPTAKLTFRRQGDELSCVLEAYGILVGKDGHWVENDLLFAKRHALRIPSSKLNEVRAVDFVTSEASVRTPEGEDYTLVVVVRQGPAAEISSAVVALDRE